LPPICFDFVPVARALVERRLIERLLQRSAIASDLADRVLVVVDADRPWRDQAAASDPGPG